METSLMSVPLMFMTLLLITQPMMTMMCSVMLMATQVIQIMIQKMKPFQNQFLQTCLQSLGMICCLGNQPNLIFNKNMKILLIYRSAYY